MTGPIFLKRLVLSTGTASKASLLSAPTLCLRVLKGHIYHAESRLTFITASIKTSMPCCFATDIALASSSLEPHRVLVVPFWWNSPRSHCDKTPLRIPGPGKDWRNLLNRMRHSPVISNDALTLSSEYKLRRAHVTSPFVGRR